MTSLQPPKYSRYRDKYARVTIDRKVIHLGEYRSEKSKSKYKRLIAQWSAKQPVNEGTCEEITVADVLKSYRSWAEKYYGDFPRGRYRNLLPTIRMVRELYADLPAEDFTPKKLKVVRQSFIQKGNSRGHVNTCTRRVIAIFEWAAEEELVSGSLAHALSKVKGIQRGRVTKQNTEPIVCLTQADLQRFD